MADQDASSATDSRQRLFRRIKAYVTLSLENIRLTIAEKLILLLATLFTIVACIIVGGITLMFVTVALAQVIALWLPLWAAYAIMAGVNILLLLVILILRRPLIINPISKAISRIILS